LKLFLINSNEDNAFAALMNDDELIIKYAREYSTGEEKNSRVKPPDKLIECVNDVAKRCKEKSISLDSIDAVSVNAGPGSFTGIRVGLSIAKGLADALDKKIITINNFDLFYERIKDRDKNKSYLILLLAKLPEYYYAVYRNSNKEEMGFIVPEQINENFKEKLVIAGNFSHESDINVNYFEFIGNDGLINETNAMAELTKRYFNTGQLKKSDEVEALYIKDFVARKKIK
jgi:tRNA threonylcarbamoyladenosine biosynthesis protein TsaB